MRILSLLLAFSLSLAAVAEDMNGVHVVPFGPTEGMPVDVHIPMVCGVQSHSVTRVGNVVKITLLDPGCVVTLPIPYIYTVRLPYRLSAGEYRVEVFLEDTDDVYGATEFVVRVRQSPVLEIHPFAIRTSVAGLRVRLKWITPPFSDFTIEVDGVPATDVVRTGDGTVWFTPPPRQRPGLATVTMRSGNAIAIADAALYYFDVPDRSVFERILFPVLFSADGANGSRWVSEGIVSNPREWFVENGNSIGPIGPCIAYPCGERIEPGEIVRLGHGFPRGATLLVPRPEAPALSFGLRVRDVSRQAEGLGTQIPVVRERDFTHGGGLTLLDVPLDPRYRVKLRIYAIEPVLATAGQMTLRDTVTRAVRLVRHFELREPTDHREPYYAEIDLPPGAANERVNVFLTMPLDSTAWAFATVTNNETQQVTIVTPNGSGLQPCDSCTVP